jgi:hypothetical protein
MAKEVAGITLKVKASDFDESVDLKKIVASHSVTGGPAPATVEKALAARKKLITQAKSNVAEFKKSLGNAEKMLESTAKAISEEKIPDIGRLKNSKRMVE